MLTLYSLTKYSGISAGVWSDSTLELISSFGRRATRRVAATFRAAFECLHNVRNQIFNLNYR